ncbi:putative periplasmic/secreted protein [Hydrogenophaga sp. T4]|nr:putative periplasmic/secreted protein [Hydrogenophaga sp. T4]
MARPAAQPELLELRTGQFSLYPRYGTNGKINGWRGSAELWLEGRDFGRISSTAGKIQTLTMGDVGFSLSRKAQQRLESDVQGQAIERFKGKAAEVAKVLVSVATPCARSRSVRPTRAVDRCARA